MVCGSPEVLIAALLTTASCLLGPKAPGAPPGEPRPLELCTFCSGVWGLLCLCGVGVHIVSCFFLIIYIFSGHIKVDQFNTCMHDLKELNRMCPYPCLCSYMYIGEELQSSM